MAESREAYKEFKDSVNMTASELAEWLKTEQSRSVGIKSGTTADKKTDAKGKESTGHASGRRIVAILKKKQADLTGPDLAHMKKVTGYIKRHMAQKPSSDIKDSRWRYSLMNWGHDPMKSS